MNPRLAAALFLAAQAATAAGGSITGKVTATPEKYLKDTIVYVKEVPGPHTPKSHTMDQKGMEFRPHLLTIVAGDSVKFLNSDSVEHNVYTPDGEAYNLGMFGKGQSREQKFEKTGVYTQLCSVHPEMLGYIFVGQNAFAVAVQKDGAYKIEGVPPGSYQLAVWNPKLKADDVPVAVEAGKPAHVDFALAR